MGHCRDNEAAVTIVEVVKVLIDLHVHTSYSEDFTTTVEDAVNRCREKGLSALLLAEFDTIPDADEVASISEKLEFPIFIGVDIDTDDGRLLGIPRDPSDDRFKNQFWDSGGDSLTVAQVIEKFAELDGAVIAAHPYLDDGGPYLGDRIYKTTGLHGVEVVCGVKKRFCNDRALEAASSIGLPTAGGSDAGPEGQRLGSYATAFLNEITNQDELVTELHGGAFWAVELGDVGTFVEERRNRRHSGRGRGGGRGGRGGGRGGRGGRGGGGRHR